MAKFTLQEVAKEYKVSEKTIIKQVEKGDLQGIKIGWLWRFTQDQLDEWQNKRTVSYPKRKKLKLAI